MPTKFEQLWRILTSTLGQMGAPANAHVSIESSLDSLGLHSLMQRLELLKQVRSHLKEAGLVANEVVAERPVYGFAISVQIVADVLAYMDLLSGGANTEFESPAYRGLPPTEVRDVPEAPTSIPEPLQPTWSPSHPPGEPHDADKKSKPIRRARVPVEEPDSWVTSVLFATDRAPAPDPLIGLRFGAVRSPELVYGECEVSIPARRKLGELRTPKWWRLEFRPDPKKHFFLKSATQLSVREFYGKVSLRLDEALSREILIFVHGYNVTFESAALRTAQLALDLKFEGAPILYSWPSHGKLQAYPWDASSVANSALLFVDFLAGLAAQTGATRVHVIAHSMGNQAVCGALYQLSLLAEKRPKPIVGHLALAAPDLGRDLYRKMAPGIRGVARSVTLYASSRDRAIQLSRLYNGEARAGEPIVVTPGIALFSRLKIQEPGPGYYHFPDT
jgi:esterase/lipase superfamily enzyme